MVDSWEVEQRQYTRTLFVLQVRGRRSVACGGLAAACLCAAAQRVFLSWP